MRSLTEHGTKKEALRQGLLFCCGGMCGGAAAGHDKSTRPFFEERAGFFCSACLDAIISVIIFVRYHKLESVERPIKGVQG
jgi:hypothetical protein